MHDCKFIVVQGGKSYKTSNLEVMKKNRKNSTTYYILNAILYNESLLIKRPGFDCTIISRDSFKQKHQGRMDDTERNQIGTLVNMPAIHVSV